MNKKIIAVAVAAAVAAPAAFADATVYGRINNVIELSDNGSSDSTDLSGIASRFGIKASSDLGNGLTASGKYEFSTTTDKEKDAIGDIRIATVGLSGAFGSITLGNQWSAYFNTVGTDIDTTYWQGGAAWLGHYRSSNVVKYANDFGPVHMEADIRVNGSGEGSDVAEGSGAEGFGLGARIAATDSVTIGLAVDSEDGVDGGADVDRMAISANVSFGDAYAIISHSSRESGTSEDTHNQLWVGTSFGSTKVQLGYGSAEVSGAEPTQITLGVYHNMGGGFRLYYEGADRDNGGASADTTNHLFGMRYDF